MIREIEGDLWDLYDEGMHRIVITTNIGWSVPDKVNNMGAGIALQAARRFPWLPSWYGRTCARLGAYTPVLVCPKRPRLILFPVKPLLSRDNPERSWDQLASLELIERGLRQLLAIPGPIALSTPGAGNGKLEEAEVAALVRRILAQDPNPRRFVLVRYQPPLRGLLEPPSRLAEDLDFILPDLTQHTRATPVHALGGRSGLAMCGAEPLSEGAFASRAAEDLDVTCAACRRLLRLLPTLEQS